MKQTRKKAGRPPNDWDDNVRRFWERVKKGGQNDCWMWQGTVSVGYGKHHCWELGGHVFAHRFSMFLHLGRILPRSEKVLHKCPDGENKLCVNPRHLYVGTISQNARDAIRNGRWPTNLGEKNGQSILTRDDVLAILRLYEKGISRGLPKQMLREEIARQFGTCAGNVYLITSGRAWQHVTGINAQPPAFP